MIVRTLLILGSSFLVAAGAQAQSVTIIGANSDALTCFRAADSDLRRPDALPACAAALNAELSTHDRMATHINRGVIRFRLEDTSGALADFDAALAMDPDQPDALINKGITMLAGGADIGPSMALIEEGLNGGPQRPWVGYYGRAVAHELAGRDAQAYHDYRRAQELRPGWAPAEQALSRFSVRG
ncbi:tetratricopeptide repeat protein [Sphingosinicella sp. CPCC 101087]|uniref:tetratricopeptide repeat protein n=1 Tax=Sphingosinicella sp. CPCC 101087 TaxID=2497754 RepID=UPI00101C0191|nr:tetratricopeptide repeat protein [Sphingosinicella sp. CPCC 101087]